ncbi:MAG: hypothetical protein LK562_19220 [Candidatus Accumulibacter phosphatis]|nr:hypothetical protein [Candidatus Accumulibacter phosphatis]
MDARPRPMRALDGWLNATTARSSEEPGMIDVRWPQQHYARTAVWAGQRFPLLQRLLARAGAGEIQAGDGHAGLVYRKARAFPVTLANNGADLPGTAATWFDTRWQANPNSSGKIDLAPYYPAASTEYAGPPPDHLALRTTRPPGVIRVQQSRQQASRTAGELGQTLSQTLSFLKPLLARHDSGQRAETRSGLFRVLAASSAPRPATVRKDHDLTASATPGDSPASRPAGEAANHGQIGSRRSVVTKAASAAPELAVQSTIAGRIDRPAATRWTAESSPPTVANLRVRRKALPTAPVFPTRHGTPLSANGPVYPTPAFPSEAAASNRPAIHDARVAAKLPLAAARKTIAHAAAAATRPGRADDGEATLCSRATGIPIRQAGDSRLPVSIPPATPGAVRNPEPIDGHRLDQATALPARLAAPVGPPAAASARPAIDRTSADRGEPVHTPFVLDFSATTNAALHDLSLPDYPTPAFPAEEAAEDRRAIPDARVAAKLPLAAARQTIAHAAASATRPDRADDGGSILFRRVAGISTRQAGDSRPPHAVPPATPGAIRNPAPIDDHRTVDPPLAGHALMASSAAEGRDSLPFAYPTAARHAAEINEATPGTAVTSALPVIQEKATATATDPGSGMVWRQRIAASPSPGAGSAGILERTKTPAVAARPSNGDTSSAPADSQPSLSTPTSDVPLPGATLDWEPLIAQLSRRIHRQLTIERERRGVKGWN